MPIHNRNAAAQQIRRLSALRGWRDLEREAKTELCDALMRVACSVAHATAIIDAVLCDREHVPTPAEISRYGALVPDPAVQMLHARASCVACRGTGYRHYWALATWSLNSAGLPTGRALIEELPRPASISHENWDVSGPRDVRTGAGQHVYEMVERCHCTRS